MHTDEMSIRSCPEELSIAAAAEILNVSRPFLISLLDAGQISYRMVGTHRRVKAASPVRYLREDDARCMAVADELAAKATRLGCPDATSVGDDGGDCQDVGCAALRQELHEPTGLALITETVLLSLYRPVRTNLTPRGEAMTATLEAPDRINIDDATMKEAESSVKDGATRNVSLVLQDVDGSLHTLPQSLQRVLLQALDSVARTGSVSIRRCPEELSSTTAAELLDVSRPTVLKWAKDGRLNSFKVGTHTRFHREDVLTFKAVREQERRSAFDELRALDMEHIEEFDDLG